MATTNDSRTAQASGPGATTDQPQARKAGGAGVGGKDEDGESVGEHGARRELRLQHHAGRDALLALRPAWDELAAAQPDPGFHHQHAWHLAFGDHLAPTASPLQVFTLHRGARLAGIFPLQHTRRTLGGLPLRIWSLPEHPHMNLADALLAPDEDPAALLATLCQGLGRHGPAWDALHLPRLLGETPLCRALADGGPGPVSTVPAGLSMHFCCASLDDALAGCSTAFRRNLRRQGKKLAERGEVAVHVAHQRAALDAAFAHFLRLEASGWKGEGGHGSAIGLHAPLAGFYRDLMHHFAATGRSRINLLTLDGQPVAAQFSLWAGDTLYLLKIAYDETYRAEAPGSQLLLATLEDCCALPSCRRLSLVTGPEWARGRWNPLQRPLHDLTLFNRRPRGLAAYAARHLAHVLSLRRPSP